MRKAAMILGATAMLSLGACSQYGGAGGGLFGGLGGGGDPYYADQYYRDGPNYQTRRLGRNDQVFRGRDNRYYCKRDDGSTGLIVGAIAGGVLGNIIAPGGSKTLGSLIGGAGGAIAGEQIDRGDVQCR
ncbi:glycine zipper 2TM domain-containing protein [Sphingomonas japonica]|uniref:17 kDa surface antigen n=1 Tax=Sphingomonas japonica TaxID=511662 RepID=A0ABX0TWV3_9SPHN|nr:glycine zipper 2TM domain-containing protein [Sphingomonas japonica]NIJ22723.1 hypothetical protein [Sphingomonas japonica]